MKTYHSIVKIFITVLFISLLFPISQFSQQNGTSEYQYLSPVPGSEMNSPGTNIIIRYGIPYNSADVFTKTILEVIGNKSGPHSGKIILAENERTLLFNPDSPFWEGETVTVKLKGPVRTQDNVNIPNLIFNFRITDNDLTNLIISNPEKYLFGEYSNILNTKNSPGIKSSSDLQVYSVMDDSLPEDFPHIKIDSLNNPAPGFIFLSPFVLSSSAPTYLIILDNYNIPVFYRRMTLRNFDFKKQPAELLSYYDESRSKYFVLDSSYQVIDSLYVKNGYSTDGHELVLTENKHSLLLSYDFQYVAMDTVVPGGDPNAVVGGLIVQEQDENKNVVFQWRSWDHFQITDATYDINLTDSLIDYVHGNAIEVDDDGNLLISCRHMDEVTKINRQSGDIIWRFGGEYCKNNQFTFINDPIGFSHQHDVRRLENGNITVFDNGNLHSPPFSRAVEYQVDDANKFAFLVWQYINDPSTYTFATGSARRLPNHNTIIGWGTANSPAISEIEPNGDVALFLSLPDTLMSYRGFKFLWKTNLFVGNPVSLIFGYVPIGDSLEIPLGITNNSNQQIEINSVYNREPAFTIKTILPITIPPFGSENITVKFKPDLEKEYLDDLHLRWDTEGQRIAQVVSLTGSADPNSSFKSENNIRDYYLSQNYPNPFNPSTTIQYSIPESGNVQLKIYNLLGEEVATLVNDFKNAGSYQVRFNASDLSSGIYYYRIESEKFIQVKKMVLIR